jgi:hypothetical protein
MVERVEALSDISLHHPLCAYPPVVDLRERGMAPSRLSKSVGTGTELRLVVGAEDQPQNFLQQFVRETRQSQGTVLLRVTFLDVDAPDGSPVVAFISQSFDDRCNFRHRHAVNGFLRCAFR